MKIFFEQSRKVYRVYRNFIQTAPLCDFRQLAIRQIRRIIISLRDRELFLPGSTGSVQFDCVPIVFRQRNDEAHIQCLSGSNTARLGPSSIFFRNRTVPEAKISKAKRE